MVFSNSSLFCSVIRRLNINSYYFINICIRYCYCKSTFKTWYMCLLLYNFNCGLILKCQINSLAPLVYYNFSHTELLGWSSSSRTCNSPKGSFIVKYAAFMYITTNKNYCFWTVLLGYSVAIHNNILKIYYINIDLIKIHCF